MSDDVENQIDMFSPDEVLAQDFLAVNNDNAEHALRAACQVLLKTHAEKESIKTLVSSGMVRGGLKSE